MHLKTFNPLKWEPLEWLSGYRRAQIEGHWIFTNNDVIIRKTVSFDYK